MAYSYFELPRPPEIMNLVSINDYHILASFEPELPGPGDTIRDSLEEKTLTEGEVSLLEETRDRVIPPSDEFITIVDHTIADELKDAAGKKGKKGLILMVQSLLFIISSDSTHSEPLNAFPFASLKSVSNPLLEQNKAMTVATSLVYEAGTLSSILDNASPVNDFYKSQNIDYVDAKNVYYEMDQRVMFEKKFLKREEDVKRKDKEIANIKTHLENFEGDSLEVVRLYSCVSELGVAATARVEESASHRAKNVELIGQVSDLEALCDDLKNQIKGEDQLRKEFIAMQDSHANSFEDHATELGKSLTTLDIDFDKELFPNMMKAVSSKRWVIIHGFRLAFIKFKESYKYQSRLDKAISLAIKKGNQQGLEVRLVRGKADKNSKDIESYDA
ncbi:hypothetical protein Tco_0916504 [Tanacetum coccineum]